MGTITTLAHLVEKLSSLNKEETIYAAKPWSINSKAIVLPEPLSGSLPLSAKNNGLEYFLEVFIADDLIKDWEVAAKEKFSLQQKCLRLIQYAINDA